MWRQVRVFLLFLFVASALGLTPAFAKGKDKGKGKDKDEDAGIQLTGIEAFDSTFKRVGQIDRKLASSEKQLKTGKNNLNTALGLKKGTPVEDGIAELKKLAGNKVSLATNTGSVPKLKATDAVPSNVEQAILAVNDMTEGFAAAVADLTSLAPEIDGLVKDTTKMPGRLKTEFSKGGASIFEKLFELPKTTKKLNNNIGITKGLPGRANSVSGRMTEVLDLVTSQFGGKSTPKAPSGGKAPAGGKKGKGG